MLSMNQLTTENCNHPTLEQLGLHFRVPKMDQRTRQTADQLVPKS